MTQKGFSLVELLVVFIITSMVVSVILPAIEQIEKIQSQANSMRSRMQGEIMQEDWWRQVIQGLQADYPDGKDVFRGSEKEIFGLTSNQLNEDYGGLGAFQIRLRYDEKSDQTYLEYQGMGRFSIIKQWKGSDAVFVYLSADGMSHSTWPPKLGEWPQLPSAIVLQAKIEGAMQVVIAGISTSSDDKIRLTGFLP